MLDVWSHGVTGMGLGFRGTSSGFFGLERAGLVARRRSLA